MLTENEMIPNPKIPFTWTSSNKLEWIDLCVSENKQMLAVNFLFHF